VNKRYPKVVMGNAVDWDSLSALGKLRAVIDPNDGMGFKNMLIDRVHWLALRRQLHGSKNVLDFGCGTGRFAKRIKAMGARYTGIDSSKGMIQAAQKWNTGDEKSFQHFDGVTIPFPDASFDTVLCCRVFIHLLKTPKGDGLLHEILRVLVPNGRIVLLEEASLSQKKSGQAPCTLAENDFKSAFSRHFDIRVIHKVRSSEFSMFARKTTEIPGYMPYFVFRLILAPLSRIELFRAMRHTNDYYAKVTYYDFLIAAVKI
jgi:ubiquinone/menaquinone biosynthesis C-methylase UbiE